MPFSTISVIVTNYNTEQYLERCLGTIPERPYIEVIIVDDCSTDNSIEVIENFIKKSRLKVKLIKHTKNLGASEAFNTGLDNATGDYIYQLDSDDYLYPTNFADACEMIDGSDLIWVYAQQNNGYILKPGDGDYEKCAGWMKLIRREFLGDMRRVKNYWGGDTEMHKDLLDKPHTSQYTKLLVYHYNYPREGSIMWNLSHGN